jgi:hypothetical protein
LNAGNWQLTVNDERVHTDHHRVHGRLVSGTSADQETAAVSVDAQQFNL